MLAWKKTTLMSILIAALILTFVAFILSIVAISLQKWQYYDTLVTPVVTGKSRLTVFSRWRGMFMECLYTPDHAKYVNTYDEKVGGSCFDIDKGGRHPDVKDGAYWHIIRLRRGFVAMMIISIISIFAALLLLGASLGMVFLPKHYATRLHSRLIKASGWVCLLSILSLLATLFIFHVLIDEEKYKKSFVYLPEIYSNWDLTGGTIISYAACYFLVWAALALLGLAALLLLLTFCWGLDRFFTKRVVRTVEEKTIITGGPYGQPTTIFKGETVQVTSLNEGVTRTHAGDTTQPYAYTGVPTTNAY